MLRTLSELLKVNDFVFWSHS